MGVKKAEKRVLSVLYASTVDFAQPSRSDNHYERNRPRWQLASVVHQTLGEPENSIVSNLRDSERPVSEWTPGESKSAAKMLRASANS